MLATNAKVVPIPNVLVDACPMEQSARLKETQNKRMDASDWRLSTRLWPGTSKGKIVKGEPGTFL